VISVETQQGNFEISSSIPLSKYGLSVVMNLAVLTVEIGVAFGKKNL
jgi:hypothetical protein